MKERLVLAELLERPARAIFCGPWQKRYCNS
jgi:hypothetical protein